MVPLTLSLSLWRVGGSQLETKQKCNHGNSSLLITPRHFFFTHTHCDRTECGSDAPSSLLAVGNGVLVHVVIADVLHQIDQSRSAQHSTACHHLF